MLAASLLYTLLLKKYSMFLVCGGCVPIDDDYMFSPYLRFCLVTGALYLISHHIFSSMINNVLLR